MSVHLFFKRYTDTVKLFMYNTKSLYILGLDEFYLYTVFKLYSCPDCKLIYSESVQKLFYDLDTIKLSKNSLKVLMEHFSTYFRNKYLHKVLKETLFKDSFITGRISLIKQAIPQREHTCVCSIQTKLQSDVTFYPKEAVVSFASYFCDQFYK